MSVLMAASIVAARGAYFWHRHPQDDDDDADDTGDDDDDCCLHVAHRASSGIACASDGAFPPLQGKCSPVP